MATGFTGLGIVNKLLTVMINLVIWDRHSTVVGTIGLLICMLGGVLFQQSSSKPKADEPEETRNHNGEQKKLLEMETIPDSNNSEKPVDSGEQK